MVSRFDAKTSIIQDAVGQRALRKGSLPCVAEDVTCAASGLDLDDDAGGHRSLDDVVAAVNQSQGETRIGLG